MTRDFSVIVQLTYNIAIVTLTQYQNPALYDALLVAQYFLLKLWW